MLIDYVRVYQEVSVTQALPTVKAFDGTGPATSVGCSCNDEEIYWTP